MSLGVELIVAAAVMLAALRCVPDVMVMFALSRWTPLLCLTAYSLIWSQISARLDAPNLAIVTSAALGLLFSRAAVDLLFWLYDYSPVIFGWFPKERRFALTWAGAEGERYLQTPLFFLELERASARAQRLSGGHEPIWGYLKRRARVLQEIEYRQALYGEPEEETPGDVVS